jgi:hypothetical protein
MHKSKQNKQKVNCSYNFQENVCIHSNSNLIIVIIIYNSPLERENVINEKILRKHVNNNLYIINMYNVHNLKRSNYFMHLNEH